MIIVKMKFGSHLYGTNTPESDTDYKGIFMPDREQVLLGKIPKSINTQTKTNNNEKNSSEDVDTELYSLHYFIHLACKGETVALDMLHAPDNMIIESSDIWHQIVAQRQRFYTKNLKAFVGYARRQASKYGIKGSRLSDARNVLTFLKHSCCSIRSVWDDLPEGEHIFKHPPDINGIRMYEVCGKKIPETVSVEYAYNIVDKFEKVYGERVRQAANNENIDWKAISHALRAAFQVKQILTEGTITFPLKEAAYLKDVKQGLLDYQTVVCPRLEELMDEVEQLSAASILPDKVDRKYWDDFLIKEIEKIMTQRVINQKLFEALWSSSPKVIST